MKSHIRLIACLAISLGVHIVVARLPVGIDPGSDPRVGPMSLLLVDSAKPVATEASLPVVIPVAKASDEDRVVEKSSALGEALSGKSPERGSTVSYRSVRDLDIPPRAFFVPPLDSPEMSGTVDRERVEVEVRIGVEGAVDWVGIVSGKSPFSDRVREAFLGAKFNPGFAAGQAVPSVIYIEVEYPALR